MIKQKRIVIYLPADQYQVLRAKLILHGKTVSQWFREKTKEFLSKNGEINRQLETLEEEE